MDVDAVAGMEEGPPLVKECGKQGHRHSRGRGLPQDPQPSPGGREEGSPPVAGAVVATGSGAGGDAVASGHEETIAGCRLREAVAAASVLTWGGATFCGAPIGRGAEGPRRTAVEAVTVVSLRGYADRSNQWGGERIR